MSAKSAVKFQPYEESLLFELKIDMRPFERAARTVRDAQDQVPYALSLALNKANENARNLLIQEWPRHVKTRNSSFIGYALRRVFATKHSLRIEIYDQTGKSFLKRLDKGGTHTAKKSNLAIPVENNVRVGAHGIRASQLPRNLTGDVFVASRNGHGAAIWKRMGKGKRKRLKLMYVLKPAVQVNAKMPFTEDFTTSILNETRTSFPAAMARAMKSRRVT